MASSQAALPRVTRGIGLRQLFLSKKLLAVASEHFLVSLISCMAMSCCMVPEMHTLKDGRLSSKDSHSNPGLVMLALWCKGLSMCFGENVLGKPPTKFFKLAELLC